MMTNFKFGIGPMSKNIVKTCIKYANTNNVNMFFIPSRRQIDFFGGYVGYTTKEFSQYVRENTKNILIKRDHGGPFQGEFVDDGIESLEEDSKYVDFIHIDPWKKCPSFESGCEQTADLIKIIHKNNPNIKFEIGTEESIFRYEANMLEQLLSYLANTLTYSQFIQIKYAVIQCGTSLKETTNTGSYNKDRLLEMLKVCNKYNLLSKEHNGDYIAEELIFEKFKYGLNAINIAPEFGLIETSVYLDVIKNTKYFDIMYDICYLSEKWKKWVSQDFIPSENKEQLIKICGHYVLNLPDFISGIKNNLYIDIDDIIENNICQKLDLLYGRTKNNIL